MPPEIQRIADNFLHNPVRVEVSRPATAATTIAQSAVAVGRESYEKRDTLRRLIRTAENFKNAIIFCNRKTEVAQLHRSLVKHDFNAVALHGDLDQSARTAALEAFRNGEAKLLIASDVAARGLDIPDVSHVFNFDVPHHPDDYVHRIGRTGRAGKTGTAITLVAPIDQKSLAAIEKLIGQKIAFAGEPPRDSETEAAAEAERPRQGSRGRRGGRQRHDRDERPAPAPRRQEHDSPAPVARLDEARSRRRPEPRREPADEADTSHLPAFLLRPVTLKA
jgi:superfamily II DNA/RNA helicase